MNSKVYLVVTVGIIFVLIAGIVLLQRNTLQSLTGQSEEQTTIPSMQEVSVTDSGFDPQTLRVKKGTIVTWVNNSSGNASVNSNDYPTNRLYPFLNLGEFSRDSSVQVTFDKPGTYGYHNYLKPDQKGTVIVE